MDWLAYTPPEPVPAGVPVEVELAWKEEPGRRPALDVRALRDGELVANCDCGSMAAHAPVPEAQPWLCVHWLGVTERLQGKGLGRFLLQTALRELHGAGYRHAAISTDWRNHRAFLFYTNMGFRVNDWTYGLGRDL